MKTMATFNKLIQVMMGVTDMAASKAFYADTLGFAVLVDYGQGERHWVNLSFPEGGVTLTLTTFLGDQLRTGSMSLYIATPDIQQAYDVVIAKGVQPTTPIGDDLYGPGSGVKWFTLADPDGNTLTIVQS
jgi:catechol 2,3-dioxygenase-like lactoylglutathione lyase family enzyme